MVDESIRIPTAPSARRVRSVLPLAFLFQAGLGGRLEAQAAAVVPASDRRVAVEEVLAIGHVAGPPEYTFGAIGDVEVDAEAGEIFVLDAMADRIRVYDWEGEHLRSWGREGEGPGEFSSAAALAVQRDTVVVADVWSLHVFARDGSHLRSFRQSPVVPITFPVALHGRTGGWWLELMEIESGKTGSVPNRRVYPVDLRAGMAPDDAFLVPRAPELRRTADSGDRHWSVNPILHHRPTVSVDHAGRSVHAPTGEYTLVIGGNSTQDGAPVDTLRVAHDGVPVSGAELRRRYAERTRETCRTARCPPDWESGLNAALDRPLPEVRPVVGELVAASRGQLLLVQRVDLDPDPPDDEETTLFDVVRTDGSHLGRVRFPDRFEPFFFDGRYVAGVTRDDLDVHFVTVLEVGLE